ncbi:hypothetical protein [uncultured Clostridium sp.]|uniref:hypothetical protein n=1 Tax=uncultured Clostridium sp. TaxID=59620 RepID=UPI002611439F|nr:hypothetical protein [uncultured Clostridium sp.]
MDKELLRLKDILELNETNFSVERELLRFSLINNDSEFVFSEFYNFDSITDVLSFIKNVIIPSTAISILTQDNGQLVITIEDSNIFLEQLKSYGADESLVKKCANIYNKLSKVTKDIPIKKIEEVIDFINFELSEGQMIMLSVEYAKNTKMYLERMYNEYKEMDHLDMLEQELGRLNLCMGGFLDICEHIEKYQDEIKVKLLDKLPY